MLLLLSPAKSLDTQTPVPADWARSQPQFLDQAGQLIALLRAYSPQEVGQLLGISDALAHLNHARYAAWRPEPHPDNARQALWAFSGGVYQGLDAHSFTPEDAAWAQGHLRIVSGLYGLLRPLDMLQPYRLEMGTRLATPAGLGLYAFWGQRIAQAINDHLAGQDAPVVLNLASQEYSKAVDRQALRARVIDCVFEEGKAGQYKIIGIHAKRARGLMARWVLQSRITSPQELLGFNSEGYAYCEPLSGADRLVFRRDLDKRP